MGNLDELLDRVTIKFPFPINAEEVENNLFEYLRQEVPCNLDYSIIIRGNKGQGDNGSPTSERYAFEFTTTITKRIGDFTTSRFKLLSPFRFSPNFFNAIKFDTVPGYDSIEEFAGSFPIGEAQLRLMDSVRENVEEYFSQRTEENQ